MLRYSQDRYPSNIEATLTAIAALMFIMGVSAPIHHFAVNRQQRGMVWDSLGIVRLVRKIG